MTNNVNLESLIIWKKWQNLLLFWKSIVKLILVPKNFFMAGVGIEPAIPGFDDFKPNLSYPNLYLTERALINYTTEATAKRAMWK